MEGLFLPAGNKQPQMYVQILSPPLSSVEGMGIAPRAIRDGINGEVFVQVLQTIRQ